MKAVRRDLTADLVAGLTFATVNVPQAMAQAVLATVNPVRGIYTLMAAVPIGAVFASSVYMNVSPTSALSVAAGAGLAGVPESRKLEALAVLVLLVGAIQLLAGVLRLGFLLRFVSNAVMTGFLNGVAVLIILGQLGDLTGFSSAYRGGVARALDLFLNLHRISLPATVIGGLTLAAIVLLLLVTSLRRFAFIIAIAAATALMAVLTLPGPAAHFGFAEVRTVREVSTIARSLPAVALPALSLIPSMLLPAFSVALIGLIQGAGVSQGTPNPDGKYADVSRDFLGQGAANFATSLVGGIPAGGSISGTAVLMGAGAKSRWANISVGVFVAAIVLLIAPLVERVPMPALAALLIVAGFQGLRLRQSVIAWNSGRIPATVMIITFASTLLIPLHYAVLLGMALSILLHVFRQSNKVAVTQWVLQPEGFPLEQPAPRRIPPRRLTILHVYGSLFFAAARSLEEILPDVADTDGAVVALSLRGNGEIGSTFINVIQRYADALRMRRSKLMLVGVDSTVRNQIAKTGLLRVIGEENVFLATPQLGEALNAAVEAATVWLEQPADAAAADRAGGTRR